MYMMGARTLLKLRQAGLGPLSVGWLCLVLTDLNEALSKGLWPMYTSATTFYSAKTGQPENYQQNAIVFHLH
jgi:hypothetical protein